MKFNQGDRVVWDVDTGIPVGEGIVCGIALEPQLILGRAVMVRLNEPLYPLYPYDTICVWESWLSLKE